VAMKQQIVWNKRWYTSTYM